MMGPLALLTAIAVFMLCVQWRTDHPSPGEGLPLGPWLKSLVSRDTDTDPDPDPDTDTWGLVDDGEDLDDGCECPRCARRRGDLPPPAEPTVKAPSQLDVWIGRSLDTGAAYKDIVREGVALFGAGEATVKRAIARVRAARAQTEDAA